MMADTFYPQWFEWTDEGVMRPVNATMADRQFTIGERYRLVHQEDRSVATHNHEFAWLHDAWMNLPETIADLYPSPEHLRKRALIQAGYYDEEAIDTGSKAGALRVAAAFRKHDDFALVIVRGQFVLIRTAKSQSRRAMDRKTFQESKTKIIEVVAQLLGVSPDSLGRAA